MGWCMPETPVPAPVVPPSVGFWAGLVRQDRPEDPKRLAVVVAVLTLAIGYLGVASAVVYQIFKSNGLGPGLTAALIATAGPLGAMVYGVHRKADDNLPGGE